MTRAPDLERTRREGKRVRTSSLEVRAVASLHALPRVGLIVPKHRHNAVARNLVKRRLRELLRLELLPVLHHLALPLDVVVRASPLAYTRPYDVLAAELRLAIEKLGRVSFRAPSSPSALPAALPAALPSALPSALPAALPATPPTPPPAQP